MKQAGEIRVATYNIHRCIGGDGQFSPSRIGAVLKSLDADVIALQELESRAEFGLDILEHFATETGMVGVPGPTVLDASSQYGNALLLRADQYTRQLVDISVPDREPRGVIQVGLELKGLALNVFATHLGLSPKERHYQAKRLVDLIEDKHDSTPAEDINVLMGDINEWFLWGRPLRWLQRAFGRHPHIATFPARLPLFALDRIWISAPGFEIYRKAISNRHTRVASDHLPLVATLSPGNPSHPQ